MTVRVKSARTPSPTRPDKSAPSAMNWGPSPSVKVRKVKVDVYAGTDEDGLVDFSHEWRFQDEPGKPAKAGRIDLPKGKVAYQLQFQLHDRTGKKLKFMKPCKEAMWVTVGTDCPKRAGNGSGQIQFNYPYDEDELVVDDLNSNEPAMLFTYSLRFHGEPGDQVGKSTPCPPYEYDPDFKNGGGNS